jgi:hypothetical protein
MYSRAEEKTDSADAVLWRKKKESADNTIELKKNRVRMYSRAEGRQTM